MVIGITGGIGAGKSVVSRILRCKGFEVYDCDREARLLMDASAEVKDAIAGRFGAECLFEDGSLNRAQIASYVFTDEGHRRWLNSIVHSMVHTVLETRIRQSRSEPFFVESAILRTSGLESICDEIWLVDAPESVRLERAADRDAVDPAKIRCRMEAQAFEFEGFGNKVKVICNDGINPLIPQIDSLLMRYIENH